MPIYDYYCEECKGIISRNVSVIFREDQTCDCGRELKRQWSFQGVVWSPTRNGGHS